MAGQRNTPELINRPHYVYRCYDEAGALLYVGCTVSPRIRIEEHRLNSWWGHEIATVRHIVFPDRDRARAKELEAIRAERPQHNVKGRWSPWDDRSSWVEQDYVNIERAMLKWHASPGWPGSTSARILAAVRLERVARFGQSVAS